MAYFTPDFIAFFEELAENNSKEWFDINRKRYEKTIKKPFQQFVSHMIDLVSEDDPAIMITQKEAIFRINRDIRFSKDKTPYKTNVSAVITPGGRKDKTTPGLYFELKPDEISIFGGLYMLDKHQLKNVRDFIAGDPERFTNTINDPNFKKTYGEIQGEKNKRIPKEFQSLVEEVPLIANKAFYYYAKIDGKYLLSDELPEMIMKYYFAGKPMKEYLTEALAG